MATRIRVRKGDTEVEYEGSEQFLRTELSSLLQAASTFPSGSGRRAQSPPAPPRPAGPPAAGGGKRSARKTPARARSVDAAPAGQDPGMPPGVADVAARMGCRHGTDLVLAASAQLSIRAGEKSFSRAALLGEMKTAADYYKPVYGKNLSRYLKNLIRERQLEEPGPGIYALTARARRELKKLLAE